MKEFFKYTFATIVGLFITFILLGVIMVFTFIGMYNKSTPIGDNSVLELNLDYDIPERGNQDISTIFDPENANKSQGLDNILRAIKNAQSDPKIKGIYLKTNINSSGYATLLEIRNALNQFKTSGKFVYSFSPYFDEKNYYLASVADSVFLEKSGFVIFNGLSANMVFVKGLLEKAGIEMQYTKVGAFKGAIETYSRKDLSPENRLQITEQLRSVFASVLVGISESRKIDTTAIAKAFNEFIIQTPQQAVRFGLIDALMYEDQVMNIINKTVFPKDEKKSNIISLSTYLSGSKNDKKTKNKIAVVYAVGDIIEGKGNQSVIGSESMRTAIQKAREDKDVKAIVLRINSPGGSSFASDIIAREIALCKGIKPVVVSMGDVAASGGYYIAAMADTIIALPNSITGSIGVFGLFPNMHELLTEKLGLTFETVNTGLHSDFGRVDRALNEYDKMFLQNRVNQIYDEFTGIVEQGRRLDSSYVESIAQGRVWTATQAKELKLIDAFGGIEDAIKIAAFMAKTKEYVTVDYPKIDGPFSQLFNQGTQSYADNRLKNELGPMYAIFKLFQNCSKNTDIQMRLPFELNFN
jgi:protease IV